MLTIERLHEVLAYDQETGVLTWRVSGPRRVIGAQAGVRNNRGYLHIFIDGKQYAAHRLAWVFLHGRPPKEQIDHINRCRTDNRACNLREATAFENKWNSGLRKNNKSGVKGVCWVDRDQRWQATIRVAGTRRCLGYYKSKDAATAVRKDAELQYFGEFIAS